MSTSDITPGGRDPETPPPRRDPVRLEEDEQRYRQDYDDRQFVRRSDDDVVSTLIPYKNVRALVAYYLGVFSLIPCVGLVLGPAALILGILGISYVNKHPTAKGTGHAIAGIVLGGLTSLGNAAVLVLIAFSAAK